MPRRSNPRPAAADPQPVLPNPHRRAAPRRLRGGARHRRQSRSDLGLELAAGAYLGARPAPAPCAQHGVRVPADAGRQLPVRLPAGRATAFLARAGGQAPLSGLHRRSGRPEVPRPRSARRGPRSHPARPRPGGADPRRTRAKHPPLCWIRNQLPPGHSGRDPRHLCGGAHRPRHARPRRWQGLGAPRRRPGTAPRPATRFSPPGGAGGRCPAARGTRHGRDGSPHAPAPADGSGRCRHAPSAWPAGHGRRGAGGGVGQHRCGDGRARGGEPTAEGGCRAGARFLAALARVRGGDGLPWF